MAGQRKQVVVLGGGFAGLMTARTLVKAGAVGSLCDVTIVDAADAHVYTPWLYEAATCAIKGESAEVKAKMIAAAAFPYAELPGFEAVRFVQAKIEGVDFDTKHVELAGKRKLPYDVLVITLGAEPNYFGIPGLPDNALVLKQLIDAKRIQLAVEKLFTTATSRAPKHIVIAGAGPNGVEFVGELANTVRVLEHRRNLQFGSIKIALVDPAPDLFGILPVSLRKKAVRRLETLGVDLKPGLRVSAVGQDAVTVFTASGKSEDQVKLPADLCIWSGGVKVNSLVVTLNLPLDDRGRLVLGSDYTVSGQPGVFAAGDCAALINPHTGKADPQSAQVAHYQAHVLAGNILRSLQGQPLKPAHLPARWAFFSALGGAYAAGTLGGMKFWGLPAFALRRISDLYYFLFLLPPRHALKAWLVGVRLYRKNDR
ncbi:MAG: NAD(P)/FAD-dependent oxidoreductase [Patescibacteria group bacterium]